MCYIGNEPQGREEKKGQRGEEERKEMERKDNFSALPGGIPS